ncbi:MAG: LysM peptidoglycan-binding domain-containing protein [Micrococcales bacterium]|nr:LysM peptidoglycan-binding domain-containing protein [Micrococcales bacterium]
MRSSQVRAEPPLRLTTRGRVVLALLALVVIAVPLWFGARAAQAEGPLTAPQVERHVVEPGDTLWQIASSVAAPGEDVRDVVRQLVRLNNLPGSGLLAGQVIVIPVSG